MARRTRSVRTSALDVVVCLLTAATIGGLAVARGGYDPFIAGSAALVMLWYLAVGLAFTRRADVCALDMAMLGCIICFLAWKAGSYIWSIDPAQTVREAQRDLVVLASATALILLTRRYNAVAVLAGVAGACTLISTVAVVGWLSDDASAILGIRGPLGYSNALGLLAGMGLILALGFASATTLASHTRFVAIGAASVLILTIYLSASRGALAALLTGAIASVVAAGPSRKRAAGIVACVVALAGAAILAGWMMTSSPRTGVAQSFAMRDGATTVSPEPRLQFWSVALYSASQRPIVGHGAGTFSRLWTQHRPVGTEGRDAHNLYIETLAEAGTVGLALLASTLAVPLIATRRVRGHPYMSAAFGAYVAFLVHASVDVDWEVPATVVAALACGVPLVATGRQSLRGFRVATTSRIAAIAIVLALAAAEYTALQGDAIMQQSRRVARVGALEAANTYATLASAQRPWDGEVWLMLGEAALARGDARLARNRLARGIAADPHSWLLWSAMGRATDGTDRLEAERHAETLNPFGQP